MIRTPLLLVINIKMRNIKKLYREYIEYRELKGLHIIKLDSFRKQIDNGRDLEWIKNSVNRSYRRFNIDKLYNNYLIKEKGFKLKLSAFKNLIYKGKTLEEILNREIKKGGRKVDNSFLYSAMSMYHAGYSIAFIARELNKNYTVVYKKIKSNI